MDALTAEILTKSINSLADGIFKTLGKRHSVDVKYIIDSNVMSEFEKCLSVATTAFVEKLVKVYLENDSEGSERSNARDLGTGLIKHLKSQKVMTEISKLLDPGVEIFDKGILVRYFYGKWNKNFRELDYKDVDKSWDEFLKAFSFASRSTPHLREFLRASYEAGSFRAISNIDHNLDTLISNAVLIRNIDKQIKRNILEYNNELIQFKEWAKLKSTN